MPDLPENKPLAGIIIPWFDLGTKPSPLRLPETEGLAFALGCDVAFVREEYVRNPSPSHLLSGGLLARLAEDSEAHNCDLIVIDGALSPVQQRNLERHLGAKVIDRTGLILEIFGLRARTKEGVLQVELARLLYERSRLVRTWTHLERQRGGRGFLSGPGETQLEADRRMIDTKIRRLRRDLTDVKRTRRLQREGRVRSGKPIIALVGYTNAGKSTLFNLLAEADVFAKDMPFATLDPTIRRLELPALGEAALVDTVGFITDLPTHLVDSFQATLEEALEADLLIHVRDMSSVDHESQREDVMSVLRQLEKRMAVELPPMIEAWNKMDLVDQDQRDALLSLSDRQEVPVAPISAITASGVEELIQLVEGQLRAASAVLEITLESSDGAARAWLFDQAEVLEETYLDTGGQCLNVRLDAETYGRFLRQFPQFARAASETAH